MSMSPTQLSLRHMRAAGYQAFITEHWDSFARLRRDLFGFCDVLCLREGEVVAVQTTSYTNVSARVNKIADHDNIAAVRKAGIRVIVHGWRKVGNRWTHREVDCS